jgi:hypothetical protein
MSAIWERIPGSIYRELPGTPFLSPRPGSPSRSAAIGVENTEDTADKNSRPSRSRLSG